MNFFRSSELMPHEPRLLPFVMTPDVSRFLPSLKTLPNIPLQVCFLRPICFLGPIACFVLMVTFEDWFYWFTLSCLATKDGPFGRVIHLGAILCPKNILPLYILDTFTSPATTKFCFL